mgnify:CR=1 FL=1
MQLDAHTEIIWNLGIDQFVVSGGRFDYECPIERRTTPPETTNWSIPII